MVSTLAAITRQRPVVRTATVELRFHQSEMVETPAERRGES